MMLGNKRELFSLPEHISYFNTASYAPSFKSVETAGIEAVIKKSHPYKILIDDFFTPLKEVKELFAQLIEVDEPERITTIPSVSYGMATVANNVQLKSTDEVLLIEDQFPSNYYVWKKLTDRYGATLKVISQPKTYAQNAKQWNQEILEAIHSNTALISLGQVHWSNGSLFDLKKIREKTNLNDALLIVDGSQSIGALPFSVKEIAPDAVICAGYKWLFGPYGCAYAYYGPAFDHGNPIEENWIYRNNSDDFAHLTRYTSEYKQFAQRYGAGQGASFIYIQMQIAALKQLLEWNALEIQEYCHGISKDFVEEMKKLGCIIESEEDRSKHMFGLLLPASVDIATLKKEFQKENIFVSFRGPYLRISCHLFNTKDDFNKLYTAITNCL